MRISIERLCEKNEIVYEKWLLSIDTSLLYASLKYRTFLSRVLDNSEPIYILAVIQDRLVGAMPTFIKHNSRFGNVLNSLPFFGSNGGIILDPQIENRTDIQQALMEAYFSIAEEYHVITSTIISNPLYPMPDFYETHTLYTYRDERIGQITKLPPYPGSKDKLQDRLMEIFHKKTRNAIRKAQSSHIRVTHSDSTETLQALSSIHQMNMMATGGRFKPWSVLKAIQESFTYDQDYRVYVAEREGIVIAALLVFFHNKTAEYYIPATREEARIHQPMSLLIFESMQEAVRRGCKYWNWGGTWLSLSGVYTFKSRWGTEDHKYYYYIREYKQPNQLHNLSVNDILSEYPYFYVLPFSTLRKGEQ